MKASPDLPPDVALDVVMIDATALAAGGEAGPRWIRVTPRGDIVTRDSRRYSFDPDRLVARFAADGIDVPIDIDHAISRKVMFGERADAVGWIKELAARPDGTYARVELLDAGKAALLAKTHRFVSPTFHHTEAGLATWLHSVALVAAPALAMPAVASADPASKPETTMLKALAKALGLADTADEAACLAAIAMLQTGKVDKAVHDQALANLAAAQTQLTVAQAKLADRDKADHQAHVDALLDGALKDKKIVPAQRDQYAALCATAEGLAQVKTLLEKTPAGLQASDLSNKKPGETGGALTDTELAVCASLGITPDDYTKTAKAVADAQGAAR